MKYVISKIIVVSFAIFILISSFLIHNCMCQWVQVNNGMGNMAVYSLAVNGNTNTIFAGTTTYGVYKSTNNGRDWTQAGLNGRTVNALATNGDTIFAGTTTYGVYKSTNNGTDWTQTSLNNTHAYSLAISGNYIFAGTISGVYLSTNNGTNWTQTLFNVLWVYSLAANGNYVFAGTVAPNGVHKSTDNGTSWTLTPLNIGGQPWSLAMNGNNVFVGINTNGVYLSTNIGQSWTQTSLNNRTVNALAISGNNVFAGTGGYGVYLSEDNGATWTQRNEGMGNLNILSFCILNDSIFAGTWVNGSVYRRPLSDLITGINPVSNQIPKDFSLSQNYPNPFNPVTKIKYQIAKSSFVTLKVFDAAGKEVMVLVNKEHTSGNYEAEFNGSDYPSGVYFYSLKAGNYFETRKMILIK